MKAALLVHAAGKIELVHQEWDLPELNEAVGGYIEAVELPHNAHGYINEEGKIHGLLLNRVATMLAAIPGDFIAGDMVVFGTKGPESVDVPTVYHRLAAASTDEQVLYEIGYLQGRQR